MPLDDLAGLLARAHAAAGAGQIEQARALIAQAEGAGAGVGCDEVLSALGALHLVTGDAKSSVRCLSRVQRHSKESLICLATAQKITGTAANFKDARRAMREFIAETCVEDELARPSYNFKAPQADRRKWPKAIKLLAQGKFEAAARRILRPVANQPQNAYSLKLRHKMLPLWRGEPGKRIAVIFDDGFGDAFLFGRYLPDLAARAADVVAVVSPQVFSLLAQSVKGIRFARFDQCADDLAGTDAYASVLLLPHQTSAGYGVAQWLTAGPIERAEGPHIGIVWGGSLSNTNDDLRSMRIEQLRPLFDLPGVTWHSLQIGPKAAQCPAAVIDHSRDIRDFLDTARIVASLDLVISIDSSVANLAGAMGVPVWVMVERKNDFRWGVAGERTPWFPSARVFRQGAAGWAGVLDDVRAALALRRDQGLT